MRRVLVLGGNRYFGKKLVRILLDRGDSVTLLNRGNHDDGFENKVNRIICDRNNKQKLQNVITETYDVVFDQSCFDFDQATIACGVFNGKVKKYIFTSSVSTYDYGASIKESEFDPLNSIIDKKETSESNYGVAKRQAEIAFYKSANFPITAVRFPIVLDSNDTTKRLKFHVEKIKNNEPIYFSNIESMISFISADDAAKTLNELSLDDFSGPINVASSDPISLKDFIKHIEKVTGNSLIITDKKMEENVSPYNISASWFVDCSILEELGVTLEPIKDYLPRMIKQINNKL